MYVLAQTAFQIFYLALVGKQSQEDALFLPDILGTARLCIILHTAHGVSWFSRHLRKQVTKALARTAHPAQFSTLGLWALSPGLTKPEPGDWHYEAEASPGLPKPMFEIFFFYHAKGHISFLT